MKGQHPEGLTQTGPIVKIVSKQSDNEFVNNYLDKHKDTYDKEEWKKLKRKHKLSGHSYSYKRPKRDKSPTRMKCKLCDVTVLTAQELVVHNEKRHPMCVHCRRRFTDRKAFDKHQHPTCLMCDKVFIFQQDLNEHLLTHPKCPECGETFMSQSKLKRVEFS